MLHADLSGRIIACALAVHRALGAGYPEFMYQSALELEFRAQGLRFRREAPVTVLYRDCTIGRFRVDFVVEDLVVVETKALAALGNGELRQLMNYLYASTVELGLLLNFGAEQFGFERKIHTNDRKAWLHTAAGDRGGRAEISGVPDSGGDGKRTA